MLGQLLGQRLGQTHHNKVANTLILLIVSRVGAGANTIHPSSLIGCRGEAPPERTAISQTTKSAERILIVESPGTTSPRGADPAALSGKWNEPWWIVRPCASESGAESPLTLETVSRRLPFTAATVGVSARAPTYSRPCRMNRQGLSASL